MASAAAAKCDLFAAVVEGERIVHRLPATEMRLAGLDSDAALAVDLVAGLAGHGRLIGEFGADQMPRPLRVLRLDQIAHRAVEVHAVAAQAIVHEALLGVVRWVGKDLA